jgi:hypothetical protein
VKKTRGAIGSLVFSTTAIGRNQQLGAQGKGRDVHPAAQKHSPPSPQLPPHTTARGRGKKDGVCRQGWQVHRGGGCGGGQDAKRAVSRPPMRQLVGHQQPEKLQHSPRQQHCTTRAITFVLPPAPSTLPSPTTHASTSSPPSPFTLETSTCGRQTWAEPSCQQPPWRPGRGRQRAWWCSWQPFAEP